MATLVIPIKQKFLLYIVLFDGWVSVPNVKKILAISLF